MAGSRRVSVLTIGLGVLYLAAGVAESVHAVTTGDGGLWFWFGTLFGGGTLVLCGVAIRARHPNVALTLICVGSLLGVIATAWTIVVPILAVTVIFLNLRESLPRQPE
jgi:hypothetical protein